MMIIKAKPTSMQLKKVNDQSVLVSATNSETNKTEACNHVSKYSDTINNKKKRSTIILGDSLIKDIEQHKMKQALGNKERVFAKHFLGANVDHMKSYAIPSKRYDNDLVILHVGTNDLRESKSAKEIASSIIDLATDLKTENNNIMLSSITPRNDKLNEKGAEVNSHLKSLCSIHNFTFIDNSNIIKSYHLNKCGLHLNYKGTNVLGSNMVDAINE